MIPKIPQKNTKSSNLATLEIPNLSGDQDVDVGMLSEEGKLLYTLLVRKIESFAVDYKIKSDQLERCEL